MSPGPRFWAVVPAAGVGRRMGCTIPKQYLEVQGQPVLEHALGRLLSHPRISAVYVALSPHDVWWPKTRFADHPNVHALIGGEERCHSVLRALETLMERAAADDWVLVHDAARPCLRAADIDRLIDTVVDHPVGGLLGMPVRDTMKRTDVEGRIESTIAREGLWHAFTPQMFRLGSLHQALTEALEQGALVTDEAAAMELAGWRPQMVEGHPDNIKITRGADLALAGFYLAQQERPC